MAGDNDPYVPLSQPAELAGHLGVELQVILGGGHLNAEFGYDSFPALFDQLCGRG
jgi:predicted alpha/beta hydrolase family esterase